MTLSPSVATVIIATYEQPRLLQLTLLGYRHQSVSGFEVIVADDGSGPETAAVVEGAREEGLPVGHVRHEHRGFRKNEILDRAVLASEGVYLLFADGDCVPRRDLVETHLALAEPDRFLSSGAVRLPASTTRCVDAEAVVSQRAFEPAWLRRHGFEPGRRRLRLLRGGGLAALLDAVSPTRATFNGGGSSAWREHIFSVNGFDLGIGYGGEDRVLGERLENIGVRGKQIRHRAVALHLHHERPYLDPARVASNRALRAQVRRRGERRAPRGLAELEESGQPAGGAR